MNIILFNGPPFSGKDAAGDALMPKYHRFKFAQPIDDAILGFLGYNKTRLGRLYQEVVQDPERKDEKLFMGWSCRQLKISFSESYAKFHFDKDIFGRLCANTIIHAHDFHQQELPFNKPFDFVITDCGFQAEFDKFCQVIKNHDMYNEITLVKLMRTGCNFNGDSRGYVKPNGFTDQYVEYGNTGTLEDHHHKVRELFGNG